MSDENVIEQDENWRVSIDYDQIYQEKPWGDMYAPVLRIEKRGYATRSEHVDDGGRPHDDDDAIENAISHWSTSPADADWEKYFLRYLKAYFGVTQVVWFSSDDYWYVAYDSKAWREYIGVPDESLPMSENFLEDWEAWVNGEVYRYVVERKVHVHDVKRVSYPGDPEFRVEEKDYDTWEYVDGCGAFYGWDQAKAAALDALAEAKGSNG